MTNNHHVIPVLDRGYVRLDKWMGNDLDPVNAAKASFAKRSDTFGEREARLLAFLQKEEHTSVFRHSALTFEVYAPLFVARQWWKYAVSSTHLEDQNGWNESSRRYITENNEYYLPDKDKWRSAPENKKQGSGGMLPAHREGVHTMEVNLGYGHDLNRELYNYQAKGQALYDEAIRCGVAPEQARLFLPAYGLYVRWWWTCSLGTLLHFLQQRLEHDAQWEIQKYAQAVHTLGWYAFPACMDMLVAK